MYAVVWSAHATTFSFKLNSFNSPLETGLCGATELPGTGPAVPALLVDVAAALPASIDCCVRGIKLAFKLGCIANSITMKKQIDFRKFMIISSSTFNIPCSVKLNNGGNSFPFGSL